MEGADEEKDDVGSDSCQLTRLKVKELAFSTIAGGLYSPLTLTEDLSCDVCRTLRLFMPGSSISARMA
jgi:hypothetical protein